MRVLTTELISIVITLVFSSVVDKNINTRERIMCCVKMIVSYGRWEDGSNS